MICEVLGLICERIGARPAGKCTCDRAVTENTAVQGAKCACGARAAGTSTFQCYEVSWRCIGVFALKVILSVLDLL